MIIYRGLDGIKLENTATALGKFDGLHTGHQLLFSKLSRYKEQGYKTVIFTFDFHPANLLTGKKQQLIYTNEERYEIIESLGIDILVEYPFTSETARMSPGDFVSSVLVDKIGSKVIVVGDDFHFGYKRSGDVKFLMDMQESGGYMVDSCEKLCYMGSEVSSTRIRDCIRDGEMEYAARLLGRDFTICGTVIHGKGNGKKVDMPTANIDVDEHKLLPPDGVYASKTTLKDSGEVYYSLTNIGTNPTVSQDNIRSVESFLIDFHEDLYEREIEVSLCKFLRPEKKFESLEKLREQVREDEKEMFRFFGEAEA